jgi:hypothetical protein
MRKENTPSHGTPSYFALDSHKKTLEFFPPAAEKGHLKIRYFPPMVEV